MKKSILIVLLSLSIPALLVAGTLFEDEKKTSDPFVGDRGGFNSMFINPAGMAGQSGFELSVSVGTATTYNDVVLLTGVADMAMSMMDSGGGMTEISSIADASQTLSDLYDAGVVTDELLNAVFEGTALDPDTFTDWNDPAAVQAAVEALSTGAGSEIEAIENNVLAVVSGDPANETYPGQFDDFYNGLPDEISVDAVVSMKTGVLIKGFGLGIYDQAVAVAYVDPTTQEYGLQSVYNELGAVAGFGFNLMDGKLALGVSGNYGLLMKNTNPIALDSIAGILTDPGSINYGYNWGVDVGAIWRPAPSLGIGVVFNDVVGYTQSADTYTADGLMGLLDTKAYLMDSLDYQVTLDMDAGISWQPDWRFVRPRLGFDLYNVIGYGRAIADNGDTFEEAMYRSLDHIRVGAHFTFFDFLKVGAQFHKHYLSVGAGLDLLFLELYGEVKVHDTAIEAIMNEAYGDIPVAADLTVRIHF